MISFVKGFTSFFTAAFFIFRRGKAWWYAVPVLLWFTLVAGLSVTLALWLRPIVTDILASWLGTETPAEATGVLQWIRLWFTAGLQLAAGWAIQLLILYLLSRIMKYIILIILSPLLAIISESTEMMITGKKYSFSIRQLVSDIFRGIRISLRNLLLELLFAFIGMMLALFLPWAAPLITMLLFAVSSYFMGFSMFDYCVERQRMNAKSSLNFMRKNRYMVTGLGLAYNLTSLFPVADWVLAPVNGAVGAVLCMNPGKEMKSDS